MASFTKLKRSTVVTDPDSLLELQELFNSGITSDSSERINSESVFALPHLTHGVRLIASSIAKVHKPVYIMEDDNGRTVDYDHDIYPLLNLRANDFQTSFAFWQCFMTNMLWSGNGYASIQWSDDGLYRPLSLQNLDSRVTNHVEEWEDGRMVGLYYNITTPDGVHVLPAEDVIHVRHLSYHNGFQGISIVNHLRSIVGLGLSVQKYGNLFFKNGSHSTRFLKIPGWLDDEQKKQMVEKVEELKSGSGMNDAHKLVTLFGGAELGSLPLNNETAQFLGSREFSLTDIANALGLTVSKLNGKGHTSYGSLEADNLSILGDTYDPLMCNIEAELNSKLLGPREGVRKVIEFCREDLDIADKETEANTLVALLNNDLISWPEARERMKLTNKRKGDFYRLSTVVPYDQLPPAPAPAKVEPVDNKDKPEEPQDTTSTDKNLKRGIALTNASLGRIKKRLMMSVEDKPSLKEHYDLIRDNLAGLDSSPVIESLERLQGELNNVLPEQRKGVLETWNISELSMELWK